MKIFIWKYVATGDNLNYFDRNSTLEYSDRIEFQKQLLDSFPIFREEWSSEEDINILKTGYFDVKLSLNSGEKSVGDKTILQFFENISTNLKNYKYIIFCETDVAEQSYSGVIDTTSFRLDLSHNEGQEYLYFSVTGIEKEFVDLLESTYVTKTLGNMSFEDYYMPYTLFYWADPGKLYYQSKLNLAAKGFDIIVYRHSLKAIWDANLDVTGTFCTITNWDAFKSFIKGFGFRFSIRYGGVNFDPVFIITLYYRSDGINQVNLDKILKKEISAKYDSKEYLAILYQEYTNQNIPTIVRYRGIIMNKDEIFVSSFANDITYDKELKTYSFPGKIVEEKRVDTIILDKYSVSEATYVSSWCMIIDDDYHITPFNSIRNYLRYIANYEFNYFIQNAKQKLVLKHKGSTNANISMGTKAIVEGSSYILERVNNFDNFNNVMETEWIEA